MGKEQSIIWVLADDRPGNFSQAIGLADSLKRPYEIKQISYNFWAKLPNLLKRNGLVGVSKESRNTLLNQDKKPAIIISAGRKTALVALRLKKIYQNHPFLINIMNPQSNIDKFDIVVAPEHDGIKIRENLITSIGALNRINENLLKIEYDKFPELKNIKSPKIALFVGGSSKKGRFNIDISHQLAQISSKLTKNIDGTLLVVTSRRTDQFVVDELKDNLHCKSQFFEWQKGQPSPYLAILQACDYVIVTGDSMSMCSESCSTGKPVYIYNPSQICSKKHLKLHQNLFDNQYAKKLDNNIINLDAKLVKKLSETNKIASMIDQLLRSQSL